MQVNLDLTKRNNTPFTAVRFKDEKAVLSYIMKNFKTDEAFKFNAIQTASERIPVDMFLAVEKNKSGEERLIAEVGNKTFKEGFLTSALSAVEKAFLYTKSLHKEQELTKGMNIPRL